MFESHDEAIYELLKNQGHVGLSASALLRQKLHASGASLADLAVSEGLIELPVLLAAIAALLNLGVLDEFPAELSAEVIEAVPVECARLYRVVPVREEGRALVLVPSDPFARDLAADLAFVLSREVRLEVGDPRRVEQWLEKYYPAGEKSSDTPDAIAHTAVDGFLVAPEDLEAMANRAPVIRFVNLVLAQAIRDKASDVHFEPFENEFKIRYRVDGVLNEMPPPPKSLALPIASRLKVLADLDIAERRVPQDGRIRTALAGRTVDLRVSTLPTQFGESIVLRVLDQSSVQLDLAQLGMPPDVLAGVQAMVRRPNGILLVTGPTSSGKTTTLYSGLRSINSTETKILTVEDPVEYEIEGIMQVPVNPAASLTFATAMRAFLRQDPDVVMIGEIRDHETAQVATQAALTGHLVLSTLHTNDAPSAVVRLLDLGVEPFLVAATLEGVLAQRLVRRICPACREEFSPNNEMLRRIWPRECVTPDGARFYRGRGCAACANSGYRGRMGIYEWLPMNAPLRALVTTGASVQEIRRKAKEQGVRSLREDGLRAVFAGQTTFEEMLKYT
ncbi:MAG: type secretion system protein [Verrucomicrobia bacterium]|nr:type secretion system protein [Verrucomicrobiota bacterium]